MKEKMNDQPIFPVVDAMPVAEVPQPKCSYPYFIVAYWPAGGWWKIHQKTWSSPDGDDIQDEIKYLQSKGWTYIKIMRLPL